MVVFCVLLALVLVVGAGNLVATFAGSSQRQADHRETLQALKTQRLQAARVCSVLHQVEAIPAPGPALSYDQQVHAALGNLGVGLGC
jgi:hypothetical protein